MELQGELKNLHARQAMQKGNYGTAASFRDSIKDADKQQQLMEADKDIRSVDGMKLQIEAAERELAADPTETGKLMKLVDALCKTEDSEYEGRALDKLQEALQRTNNFRFRARIGEINMRQMHRMERSLADALKASPGDEGLKKDLADFRKDRISHELEEFKLLMENYPTESRYKYEVAIRLFALHNYDEAIPALQQARQDPKYRVKCSVMLARAFFEAQFLDEASDTLDDVIATHATKGDEDSKEMFYWRGRTLEAKENFDPAVKSYSQVAQWDFNYRDVQKRIKELRAKKA
jgi:tetratricopeptide (TPR) repeat protein